MTYILAEFRAMLILAGHCPDCLGNLNDGVCRTCRYDARSEFLDWEESDNRSHIDEG